MKEIIEGFVEAVIMASKTPDELRAILPEVRSVLTHFGMKTEDLHSQMLELEAVADSWEDYLYGSWHIQEEW